jgi:molybdopterin converting factor small subunit
VVEAGTAPAAVFTGLLIGLRSRIAFHQSSSGVSLTAHGMRTAEKGQSPCYHLSVRSLNFARFFAAFHAFRIAPMQRTTLRRRTDEGDPDVHVEFLGVPRQRAGVAGLDVDADTLGRLLGTLKERLPSLAELIVVDRLHPAFVANLNGDEFVSDPHTPLRASDCVLILSADAGG